MKVIPVFQMRTPRLREMRVTRLCRVTPFLSRSEVGSQCLDSTAPMCLQLSVNIEHLLLSTYYVLDTVLGIRVASVEGKKRSLQSVGERQTVDKEQNVYGMQQFVRTTYVFSHTQVCVFVHKISGRTHKEQRPPPGRRTRETGV